jgi:hypothetical protein
MPKWREQRLPAPRVAQSQASKGLFSDILKVAHLNLKYDQVGLTRKVVNSVRDSADITP